MIRETRILFRPTDVTHVRLTCQKCKETTLCRIDSKRSVPLGCPHCGAAWQLGEQAPVGSDLLNVLRTARKDESVIAIQLEFHDK